MQSAGEAEERVASDGIGRSHKNNSDHHTGARNTRFGCPRVSAGFLQPSPRSRWRRKVQLLVTELFSLPSLSQSADKRSDQCQANSPQPTGHRLDDREQIKQKDECSLGGSGSISDSSDPWQFLSSLPLPFFFFRYSTWH